MDLRQELQLRREAEVIRDRLKTTANMSEVAEVINALDPDTAKRVLKLLIYESTP